MHDDLNPLYAAINARLAEIVEESVAVPNWHDAWMLLGPHSTEEERLAVYQAVRDAGSLPMDAGFYLIAWQLDAMASLTAETKLRWMDVRLDEIRQEYELDGLDEWPDELPPEYEALLDQYHAAWDDLLLDTLEEHGEAEMANLYRTDREEYRRRSEAGRLWFHGPDADQEQDDPPWLQHLLELVATSIHAVGQPGALGCRYREEDGLWEVLMFLRPVEIVGGAADGEIIQPDFSLDFEFLRTGFERVDSAGWNTRGLGDPDGPCVWIEGLYQGYEVALRVQADAPEGVEPVKHLAGRIGD